MPHPDIPPPFAPYMTPHHVIGTVIPYCQGKVVCDLGASVGDFLKVIRPYAKEVCGMECWYERYKEARIRGFDVTHGDALKDPWPEAEVYYAWMRLAQLVKLPDRAHEQGVGKLLILAYHIETDRALRAMRWTIGKKTRTRPSFKVKFNEIPTAKSLGYNLRGRVRRKACGTFGIVVIDLEKERQVVVS